MSRDKHKPIKNEEKDGENAVLKILFERGTFWGRSKQSSEDHGIMLLQDQREELKNMQSGPYEYKNVKRLKVVYPEYDDKHEYHEPILCRARDMGKVIYGKWIIGREQGNGLTGEVYADDEEKFYTAYKLVGGAEIICNFELEEGKVPCTTFAGFTNPVETPPPQDAERLYIVDKAINNVCGEPETDALDNGMIYIKMPSGVDAKQADDAAEEKSTGRPQILKGDIVRVVERIAGIPGTDRGNCHFVFGVRWDGVFSDKLGFYYNADIIAVYRFDGRDFKCIWKDEEAIERYAKEAEGRQAWF